MLDVRTFVLSEERTMLVNVSKVYVLHEWRRGRFKSKIIPKSTPQVQEWINSGLHLLCGVHDLEDTLRRIRFLDT